jgi:hypothetical protein
MLSDGWAALTARVLGALFLLAVGIIHLHEYQKLYSNIPTISTLFILSFVGAVVVCALLLLPVDLLPRPWGNLAVIGLALAGIGQAVIQFVFLWISEQRPLFGFQEPGYDPPAIRAARVTEVATVVFLTAFLILREIHRRNQARAVDQARPQTPTTTAAHR